MQVGGYVRVGQCEVHKVKKQSQINETLKKGYNFYMQHYL